jgi:hypothetical protein
MEWGKTCYSYSKHVEREGIWIVGKPCTYRYSVTRKYWLTNNKLATRTPSLSYHIYRILFVSNRTHSSIPLHTERHTHTHTHTKQYWYWFYKNYSVVKTIPFLRSIIINNNFQKFIYIYAAALPQITSTIFKKTYKNF